MRRWQLGTVAFTDYFQYHFENVSLLSALLSLGEVLTEEYTWQFDTTTTPWTVSLLRADTSAGCGIHYGRNLVGIEKTMDASALVTRLYPLGYGEGVNQLTIRDVNGGTPYIDADTIGTWGVKCSVWTDTRIEDPALLLARGRQVLDGYKNPYITYKARAVDLYKATGFSWDNYMPGKKVRVMDGEHGISFEARIVEIEKRDVNGDPGDIEITIANAPRDAADQINTLADRVGIGELYSQGATNLFAIPFADNADPDHPARMRVYIPGGLVRINRMLLSWQAQPFRAYETAAAAGGSTTQTSSGGGSSNETTSTNDTVTYTSESGGGANVTTQQRIIYGNNGANRTDGPINTLTDAANTYTTIAEAAEAGDNPLETGTDGVHQHRLEEHSHTFPHTHTIAEHSHTVAQHSHTIDHAHTIDAHSHTVDSHTHSLENSHTHSIDQHSHTVNSHSHGMEHSHTVNSHSHGLGSHTHDTTVTWQHIHSTGTAFVPGNNTGNVANYASITRTSSQATGSTGGQSLTTNAAAKTDTDTSAPGTNAVGLTTGQPGTGAKTGASAPGTGTAALRTNGPTAANSGQASPGTNAVALTTDNVPSGTTTSTEKPYTEEDGGHKHAVPKHYHQFPHYHQIYSITIPPLSVEVPDHGHNVRIPGHNHTVEIPSHTHTLTLPDHTHGITYGIFEGTAAREVTIRVDGNVVPETAISGREVDVSGYLTKNEDGKIIRNMWHVIEIVPDRLTRIEANLFAQVFIQSVGGGDY